jgi:hypothetical protein
MYVIAVNSGTTTMEQRVGFLVREPSLFQCMRPYAKDRGEN